MQSHQKMPNFHSVNISVVAHSVSVVMRISVDGWLP